MMYLISEGDKNSLPDDEGRESFRNFLDPKFIRFVPLDDFFSK
jgi:hypothetical protein